jgi:hypothetical protein
MIIIGVDFHPEFQQIALLNTTTGEVEEKRLAHPDEAEPTARDSEICAVQSSALVRRNHGWT